MAKTDGSGNPDWTREETLLALDLYFDCNGIVPSKTDHRVIALSNLLKNNPFFDGRKKKNSFRNPYGVTFKVQNLRSVATGKGLDHTSRLDRAIWEEFGDKPEIVSKLATEVAALIRDESLKPSEELHESDEEFLEGRSLTVQHRRIERNRKLRGRLIENRRKKGKLCCEICGIWPYNCESELDDAIFEAHHLVPLSEIGSRKTTIRDMALLCANCHRLIHRLIVTTKKWYSVGAAKQILCKK